MGPPWSRAADWRVSTRTRLPRFDAAREAMNIHDTEHSGGHEIDPNLVEIADMLRIQEEMHEVTEHAADRMRDLMPSRRQHGRTAKPTSARGRAPGSPK